MFIITSVRNDEQPSAFVRSKPDMSKIDLVPCFYREQDFTWEQPAKILTRAEVRELKRQRIGKFMNHGRAFRLFQSVPATQRNFSPFRITRPSSLNPDCCISFAEMQ